ncbi:NHLP family bacteriocin export ABC transporter peptidase/permease/ATPase subunit [Azospirillaceae bacterium]
MGFRDWLFGARQGMTRIRTPTVLQMEAVECGAACLSMVLGYFGRTVPLETLRYECGVSRDGTKASNIVRAARRYGLEAGGFSTEPEELRSIPLPQIIFWNFNHFVVVEGFGRGVVFLNDPAVGPRTVSDDEFNESFTGVVLTFEPGDDFIKGGQRVKVIDGLFRRLRGSQSAFVFVVLAGLGLVVPGLLTPTFVRVFVDYYMIQGFNDWLVPLLAAMAATAILRICLTWLQQHFLLRLQTKLSLSGACAFFWHVLRLPVGFFAQRYGGEIGTRLTLNDHIAELIGGELAVTLVNLMAMTIYAAIMAIYDWPLALLTITFAVLNLLTYALISRRLKDASHKLLLDQSKLIGVTMGGLQMIESFKSSGAEDLLFTRWAGYHAKVVNSEQSLDRTRIILSSSPVLLSLLGSTAVLVIGGFQVMEGQISIGALIAFQALMINFNAPLTELIHLGGQIQEAGASICRLDDIMAHDLDREFRDGVSSSFLEAPKKARPDTIGAHLKMAGPSPDKYSATSIAAMTSAADQLDELPKVKLVGRVELRNVSFGYIPTDPPLIENLSLQMEPGSRIALVGGSGSGKSTIGHLVSGLYQPWGGEILFDGAPMSQIPPKLFRNSVAIVDQNIALFEGSISDNISLWDFTMPEAQIVRAARDALIHDEIAALPGNYDFQVLEGGRNFSGGQRQRIEIARALAVNPALMILDEATSALDAITEKETVDNIRKRGCTCIIIAHRLSTIRDCDEIIVLDRGKVVERGVHHTLLAQNGYYARLIKS